MARVDSEALDTPEPVFLTATLAEARQVEDLLTGNGINFAIHVEMIGTSLFGSPRSGAVFSVTAGQAAYCRSLLVADGMGRGIIAWDAPS